MDYSDFKNLSIEALSYDSITLACTALTVIRNRYPNFMFTQEGNSVYPSSPTDVICELPNLSQIPKYWSEYVYNCQHIQLSRLSENERFWYQKIMPNKSISYEVVHGYLNLMKREFNPTKIHDIFCDDEGAYSFDDEGYTYPSIIPLQILTNEGYDWAFIVLYSDCIHYYSSREQTPMLKVLKNDPRVVKIIHTRPNSEVQENDSGILMLLGIRRILDGLPYISQQAATTEVFLNFRIRLLVELLCSKLNPTAEDFREFCIRQQVDVDLNLFNELPQIEEDLSKSDFYSLPREDYFPTVVENFTSITYSPDNPLPSTEEPIPVTMSTRQSTPATSISGFSPRSERRLSVAVNFTNDMKGILDLLSTASLTCRMSKSDKNTSLALLWHSVKDDHYKSKFHQRYNAVLFYDKMQSLGDNDIRKEIGTQDIKKMRKKRDQFQLWKDVCKLGEELGWEGDNKYASLLAVSPLATTILQRHKNEILTQLKQHLSKENDSDLKQWLLSAQQLCSAIIQQRLPEAGLMIDVYFLKKAEKVDEETYKSFVNINSHPVRQIDRIT